MEKSKIIQYLKENGFYTPIVIVVVLCASGASLGYLAGKAVFYLLH